MLGGFWLHPVSFFITGLIIVAGAEHEYYGMIEKSGIHPRKAGGILAGITIYSISTLVAAGLIPVTSFLLIIPLTAVIIVIELFRKEEKPFDSLAHTFFAILYIAAPFSLFPFSAYSREGLNTLLPHEGIIFSPGIVVGFFLILWANDTGAYLSGVTIGRHRLMERISPKKSWEGFFGGLIMSVFGAWLLSGWFGVIDSTRWIISAIIISVSGTFGDLIESMLKRSTGVKDSGSIMPGHGGFLDRFDSALLSFPILYLFISLFG